MGNENSAASKWLGGRFIVKQSIIDFFTNIVPWLVGLLAIVPILLAVILQLATNSENNTSSAAINIISAVLGLVGLVAVVYTFICYLASTPLYGLARADGKKMTTREVFTIRGQLAWRIFKVEFLLTLAIIAGFLMLVIPGIVILVLFMPAMVLVPYVIVEEDLGTVDSLKRAHQLGKDHLGKVWGIIGWFLLIGLIILIPIAIIIAAIVSRDSHSVSNVSSDTRSTSSNPSSGSGVGGNALTSIAFAYLYRWIQKQPEADQKAAPAVQA